MIMGDDTFGDSTSTQATEYEPEIKQHGNFKPTNFLIDFGMIAHNLQQLYAKMIENKNNMIMNYANEF